jgi:hypothetical protein
MKTARFSEELIIGILKAAEVAGNIRLVRTEHSESQLFDQPRAGSRPSGHPSSHHSNDKAFETTIGRSSRPSGEST